MKIDDRVENLMTLLNSAALKPVHKAADTAADTATSQAIAETPPTEVALSAAAVQLSDDEARQERLNLIRRQLADGSYNISGKDVAGKILNLLKV
jgi:anti-sigma28 factor (negative regulator of flagellin synthesis)